MLVQFKIKNHRSIKDEAVISFSASKDKSLEQALLSPDEKKQLLPVIALYGANAAGKSNVLHALVAMRNMVTGDMSKISKGQKLKWEPFAGTNNPTELEIIFYYKKIKYAYGFTFNEKNILTEYLYHWPLGREALVFNRDENKYEFRENIAEQNVLASRTPDNKLYLVSSNDWNCPQTELAYRWFTEQLMGNIEQPVDSNDTIAQINESSIAKARIIHELQIADLGISDVTIKFADKKNVVVTTTHNIGDKDGSSKNFNLLMEQESAGTQRFFARIGVFLSALDNGALLIVDELEASMHPLLTRRLIEMMQDKNINRNGAQLLFTTHDAMLLDLDLFRRDQIWFAEKNDMTAATELYALSEYSPRKGENIRKGYLQGRFGAIPFIGGSERLWDE